MFPNDYPGYLYPYKDFPFKPFNDTPLNYNAMNSPSPNIGSRFTPMINSNLISPDCKSNFYDNNRDTIKGKKLDFNDETIKFNQTENDIISKNKENFFPVNDRNINNTGNQLEINNQNNFECNLNNNNNIIPKLNNNRYYGNNNFCKLEMRNKTQGKINCTCQKTKCQKKYCACYASGKFCQDCDCKDCCNKPEIQIDNNSNNNIKSNNINTSEEKMIYNQINQEKINSKIACNCTKSNCIKKYCECYKQGTACSIMCRCMDCMNKTGYCNNNINGNGFSGNSIDNEIQKNVNNQTSADNSTNMNINISRNLKCEAIGILIEKKKIKIEKRDLILDDIKGSNNHVDGIRRNSVNILNETPKYSNKKRARQKNESANEKTCPTTNSNSGNRKKTKMGISQVNKNIKKKILQLS